MKPLFIQFGAGNDYCGMIDDHRERHIAYCNYHGYEFEAVSVDKMENGDHFWFRIPEIIKRIEGGEYSHLFALDADVIVVDQYTPLHTTLPEWAWLGMCIHPYPCPSEVWHLNAGAMYIRCCPESLAFFKHVWSRRNERPINRGWVDQAVIQDTLMNGGDWQKGFVILSHRWNSNLHDNPASSVVVAAFHGFHEPHQRRENMKAYGLGYPFKPVNNGAITEPWPTEIKDTEVSSGFTKSESDELRSHLPNVAVMNGKEAAHGESVMV